MASIQRTWRRIWSYEKPAWQSMARFNLSRKRNKVSSRTTSRYIFRHKKLAQQVAASVMAISLLGNQGLTAYAASNITTDGRTATQINVNGKVTDISTTTIRGNNSFNSFGQFNVSAGDTVNLKFNTNNLLNFVTGGSRSDINGVLNGIKNGAIGGNVYFLNPSGIMIGTTGVVNVGKLTAATPSQNSIISFLDYDLQTGFSPTSLYPVIWTNFNPDTWIKTIPLSSDGSIVVAGKINAINDVSLRTATVSNSGVIQTGAAFSSAAADFSDIVNTNDLQYGTKIGVENGVVIISAEKSAENTGTISTHSTAKDNKVAISAPEVKLGGNILTGGASLDIEATNSITADSALISTRQVQADSTLESIKDGSAVGVGKAGDVSMKVNHTTFKDKANIDIKDTVIDASGYNDSNSIRVAGSSGEVLAVASSQDNLFAWAMTGPEAKVTVANTSIKGNDVNIQAIAKNDSTKSATMDSLDKPENTASLDDFAKSQSSIGDTLVGALVPTLGNLRVGAVGTDVSAKATVTIDDKTKIKADQNVDITTAASSTATSMLFSVIGGVNVGISDAEALTNINKGAEINAGGNVTISADTSNKIDISALPIPVVGGLTPLNLLVSVGYMKSQSTADVNAGALINATGDLNVTANSTKSMSVSSSASASGGYFSAGVAVSRSDVHSDANIAGRVNAANINLTSKINALKDVTWAESSVGDGEPGSGLDLAVDWISNSFGVWVKNKLGLGKPPKSAPPTVGITGAVAVTVADDSANASITSTGDTTLSDGKTVVSNAVQSLGNVTVNSDVIENMQSGAIAQQKQREENNVLNHPTDANKKAAGVSAAVIYGQYDNTSKAFIGDGAVVDAKKNISITSDVTVPFAKQNWADIKTYTTALKNGFMSSNLGLAQALFTSWAQSSATGDVGTGSASVDIMNYNNDSGAYIGKNAKINQDKTFNGDFSASNVNLAATTTVTTLDLSGMFKSVLDDTIQAARDKTDLSSFINVFGNSSAGSGIGGSIQITLEDNKTKAYIDSGTKINANDVKVDANTDISNISLGEAGGKAEKIGFNGTVNINALTDTTYAQILNAGDIDALNNITVNAKDDIYNVNAAGGFTESNSVGVGASIGYNGIIRDTEASVGGTVTAGNNLDVAATNTGGIVSASLAGSVTSDKPSDPLASDDADPVQFVSILFKGISPVQEFKNKFTKFTSALTLGDNGTEAQAGYSVAGNVSYNGITDKTLAFIGDGTGATATTVTAKNSSVKAINDSGIYALSGAAAVAANADPASKGIAGAFMMNNVQDTTSAFAAYSTITMNGTADTDLLSLVAANDSNILSLAASGGIAPSGTGVAGQISVNIMGNTTSAYLDNSTLSIANDVALLADDDATIITVGGAVSYGGQAGYGASIGVNVMENTTQAYINNTGVTGSNSNSDVDISAKEESEIRSLTAAIGASQENMAAAFSTSGNYLGNKTKAYISEDAADKTKIDTLGSVAVSAADDAEVTTVAGSAAATAGSSVGFGASAAVVVTNDDVNTYIGDNVEVTARGKSDLAKINKPTVDSGKVTSKETALHSGLSLSADSGQAVQTTAAGGAGSGSIGLAGSAAVNVLNQNSKAYIGKNVTINGGDNSVAGGLQDVTVTANNNTNAIALAGALAIGKSAGVGVGLATQVIITDTQAYIDQGAGVNAAQNIVVKAVSDEDVTSFAGGAAGGGDAGAAGSAVVQVMTNTTKAYIVGDETNTKNTSLLAGGTAAITATDDSASNLITGSAAYGGTAGIGLSVNTDVITKDTQAYIGDNAIVSGLGKGDGVEVDTGSFNVSYATYATDDIFKTTVTDSNVKDDDLFKSRKAQAATDKVKGVAVTASNQNTVRTIAIGGSASETVAATGTVGANVVINTTEAYIGKNAKINQGGSAQSTQSVLVAAGNDYFNLGIDGAAAISINGAGIGAGAGIGVAVNKTKAYIDEGATVDAAQNIGVIANNQAKMITVVAAVGASGEVGVAGALGVNTINDETKAYVGNNADVTAQDNIAINAKDTTGVIGVDGGAGIGLATGGVGGSIGVTVINKDTAAYIGSGAAVDAEAKDSADQMEVYTGSDDANGKRITKKISGLTVAAKSSETAVDVVASGGGGLYAGVAGAAAVNVMTVNTAAYIDNGAKINADKSLQTSAGTAQAVNVDAFDSLNLVSVGGSASGGAVGVSGAADIGVINTNTNAYIGNGSIVNAKGDLAVNAYTDKTISSTAISVSGGGVGLAGGISVYVVGANATDEALDKLNSKQTDSQGNTNVQGYVDSQVHNDRISSVLNHYNDKNIKGAGNSVTSAVNGTTQPDGTKSDGIGMVASAVSTAKTVVPAGTSALIGDKVHVNEKYSDDTIITDNASYKGNIDVKAIDRLLHNANTGSLAAGGESAGGGINIAVLKNVANAHIGQSAHLLTMGDLTVSADTDQKVITVAAGLAGGGGDGVAANLSIKVLSEDAVAYIDEGTAADKTTVSADDVILQADNKTTVTSVAGSVGIGGNSGVGAALDTAVITKNTGAFIKGQSDISSTGNIKVIAKSTEDIVSAVNNLGGGGSAGIAGSVSGYSLTTNTIANIGKGATVLAKQNLWLDADSSTDLNLDSGTVAASGAAGVGASIGVAVVDKTTKAYVGTEIKDASGNVVKDQNGNAVVDAANTSVTALGNGSALSIDDGSFDISYANYTAADANPVYVSDDNKAQGSSALNQKRTANKHGASIQGIAITATNQEDIRTFSVGGAAAAGLAASLSGGVNVLNNTTTAVVGNNVKINQDNNAGANAAQSVRVAAGNDLYHLGVAGSAVGAGAAGIGAGADVTVIDDHTLASIGQEANVGAQKDVSVTAGDTEQLISVTANASVAGIAGVAGSVSVNSLTTATKAIVGNKAVIDAGNVTVGANDTTGIDMIAGSVGIGFNTSGMVGVGAAGSIGVNSITKDTEAIIGDNATVDALGTLNVRADSAEKLFTVTASGAAGNDVGIAGAISVESLDVDTHAGIGSSAQINTQAGKTSTNTAQDVSVAANDTTTVTVVDGSGAAGKIGAAGGVDVGVIKNNTLADIGDNTTVNAIRDVNVTAVAVKNVDSTAVSASGGLGAIAGGISVYSIGNGLDSNQADRLSTSKGSVGGYADGQAADTSITDVLGQSKSTALAGINSKAKENRSKVSVASSFTNTTSSKGVAAGIGAGAKITAGRDVKLKAQDSVNLTINAGAGAAGVVGLGAGIGIASVSDTVNAYVGNASDSASGTTIKAANTDTNGLVNIAAVMNETATDNAYVGSGGVIAVDAAVASLTDKSQVSASVGDYTTISKAKTFSITTDDTRTLTAKTVGVGAGQVSAGASTANTYLGGFDKAYLGNHVNIGDAGSMPSTVDIKAVAKFTVDSQAQAVKGGIGLGASGSAANAEINTIVDSHTGSSDTIYAQDSVTVDAEFTPHANAVASGINVAGGAGIGISIATAKVNWPYDDNAAPKVNAALGNGAVINTKNLTVASRQNLPVGGLSANAEAKGSAGGLLLGVNGTMAAAYNGTSIASLVGDNSTLTISSLVDIKAENNSVQVSDANSHSGGMVSAGLTIADAESNNNTKAYLGGRNTHVTAKNVSISANSIDKNTANAVSGTGGVLSGSAVKITTYTGGSSKAYLDGATVAAESLNVTAKHTALFNGTVDNTFASVVGASGVNVSHTVDTDVLVDIGQYSTINTTGDVVLNASDSSSKEWINPTDATQKADSADWNVKSAGGGALNGAAIVETINVTHDSDVMIDRGANITTGYKVETKDGKTVITPGSVIADALSDISVHDKSRINTGGAISAAVIDSRIDARGNTKVEFGSDTTVNSGYGTIRAGAKENADLDNRAAVDVYGVAGAPAGTAYSEYTGNNLINVDGNAKLQTDSDNIFLAAGQDSSKNAGNIKANAMVNLWNKTAIPITITPNPQANIVNNSKIDIKANADIASAQDIYLTADIGSTSATYTGIGKNPYLEALAEAASAISNLFGGGDVNFDIKGGSSSVAGDIKVNVDGTAETGIYRHRTLTIGGQYVQKDMGNGRYIYTWNTEYSPDSNISHSDPVYGSVSQKMIDRLNQLYELKSEYAGDAVACGAYDAEILYLQNKMVTMGLAAWRTENGKQIFVPGTSAGSNALSPQEEAKAAKTEMQSTLQTLNPKVSDQKTKADNLNIIVGLVQNRDTAQGTLTTSNTALSTARSNLPTAAQGYTRAQIQSAYDAAGSSDSDKALYKAVLDAYSAVDSAQSALDGYKNDLVAKGYSADVAYNTVYSAYSAENDKYQTLYSQQVSIQTALNSLTDAYINGLSAVQPAGPTAYTISVDDVTAKLGYIYVNADNLTGAGTLNAPGDAKITITNNSPHFLNINNLNIRDGGNILFNGGVVSNNSDINALNLNKSGATFTNVLTYKNTNLPEITIANNFNPNNYTVNIYKTDSSGNRVVGADGNYIILGTTPISVAPDITLEKGTVISNLKGAVTITSTKGDIYSYGSINAGTVKIDASNGDFIQSYVNGFDNTGGDPGQLYGSSTLQPGSIVANGNIFISARYLNINGLIQSGIDTWTLNLTDNVMVTVGNTTMTLEQARTHYASNPTDGGKYRLAGNNAGNIEEKGYVVYDAANDRFEVAGVEVHGGYVQLYGQILSTGAGKIKALDGYGTISIKNDSSKDVVIGGMDTGSGNAGIIDITDIQTTGTVHTVYKSEGGKLTTTVNNVVQNGTYTTSDDYHQQTQYSPETGLYYNWTTGTDASKTEYYHYEVDDIFGIDYSDSLKQNSDLTKIVYGETTPIANGNYLTKNSRPGEGATVGTYTPPNASGYSKYDVTYNTGSSEYFKIRDWTKRDWWSFGISGTYYLDYKLVTPIKTITTNTISASNKIGIEFFGGKTGAIDINSTNANANVLLNGAVNNVAGTTTITSGKSILQNSESSIVTTNKLDLTAAKDIGQSNNSVRFILKDILNKDGSVNTASVLDAKAVSGSINVDNVLGNLHLGNVSADNGTLAISSDGSITNAAVSDVRGQRIEVTSNNGTIGSDSSPLVVYTGYKAFDLTTQDSEKAKYGLKASAMGNINILNSDKDNNTSDNLLIDTVSSATGNVTLSTSGQMIDNNIDEQIDTRTWGQLLNYWDSMQLREGTTQVLQKQQQTLDSYANGKTSDYQTYWQLKNHIVGGAFVLNDSEKAALTAQGIDPVSYAANQTAKYQQLESTGVGSWNNGIYDAGFTYAVSTAEKDSLLNGSSWNNNELAISLSLGALKQVTDTNPIVKAPNVKGKNVTLQAGKGIGSNIKLDSTGTRIDVSDIKNHPENLTEAQKVALAAAERGEISFITENSKDYIIITQRKPVNIEVAGGVLNATAGEYAYLGSEKTVLLDNITAGAGYDVILKAGGSIVNGDASNYNIVGQNIILEAAAGGIGMEGAALRLGNNGTITARAADDIYLQKDGDFILDTIYSLQDVNLNATGNILAAYDDDLTIMSKSLKLTGKKVAGYNNKLLGISLASDGQLDVNAESDVLLNNKSSQLKINEITSANGNVTLQAEGDILNAASDPSVTNITAKNIKLSAGVVKQSDGSYGFTSEAVGAIGSDTNYLNVSASGTVDAAANEDIYLNSRGTLNLNSALSSKGNVDLKAQGSILNASGSGSATITGKDVKLAADSGTIGLNDKHVILAAAGNVVAEAEGDIDLTGNGNLNLIQVQSDAGNVDLKAYGSIVNAAADNTINVTGNNLTLTAETGSIGQYGKPVTLKAAGTVTATANQGIYASGSGDLAVAQMKSATGNIDLEADADLKLNQVLADAGDVKLKAHGSILNAAGNATTMNVSGKDLTMTAETGSLGYDGKPMTLKAAGTVTAAANQDINVSGSGNLTVAQMSSTTGNIDLETDADFKLNQVVAVVGDVNLKAHGSILNAAGDNTTINVSGKDLTLTAETGSIGQDGKPVALKAAGRVTAAANQDINVSGSGDLTVAQMNSANGNITLDTTGNLTINQLQAAQGNIDLAAGVNMKVGQIQAALGSVKLKAQGSVLNNATDASMVNVAGNALDITAVNGSIGEKGKALRVEAKDTVEASSNGDIGLVTSGDLKLNQVHADTGDVELKAHGSILNAAGDITTINVSGKDLTLTAETGTIGQSSKPVTMKATGVVTATAGQNINAKGSGDLTIAQLKSSAGNIHLDTTGNLTANQVETATGNIELAAGADLKLNRVQAAQGSVALEAQGSILNNASDASTVNVVGNNLKLTAVTGSIGEDGQRLRVTSIGTVTANSQTDTNMTSVGAFNADSMVSRAGSIHVNIDPASRGDLYIADTQVAVGMNLRGDNVTLDHVVNTGGRVLELDISGSSKPMADNVQVNVTSAGGVQFNNLNADSATVHAAADTVDMRNTNIGSRADVTSNYYHVVADKRPKNLFDSDVIFCQLGSSYNLLIDGKNVFTNATVLNHGSGVTLNGSSNQETAVTSSERVTNLTKGLNLSDIWTAGNLTINGEGLPGVVSTANLVDTSGLANFSAIDSQRLSGDANQTNLVDTSRIDNSTSDRGSIDRVEQDQNGASDGSNS